MQSRPVMEPGISALVRPMCGKTVEDIKALSMAAALIEEYHLTRYLTKRARKGGRFIWKDRKSWDFDVILDRRTMALVANFDRRTSSAQNLLSGAGTWAPSKIYHHFPTPSPRDRTFTVLSPFPAHAGPLSSRPGSEPTILTLLPDIAGRGQGWETVWGLKPSWLFGWLSISSLLPMLELYDNAYKANLELKRRQLGYGLRDLCFALAALTQYQENVCQKSEMTWKQIFHTGYTMMSCNDHYLQDELLPEFRRIRQRYAMGSTWDRDWSILSAILNGIRWDPNTSREIDLGRFSPVKLIYPVGNDSWLIDWTLMQQMIHDVMSLVGRIMTGTIAQLRGHQLEEVFGDYLALHISQFGGSVWWRGRRNNLLRFDTKVARDADIALLVESCVVVVEVKAHAMPRDLLILGDLGALTERWEKVLRPALDQVDTLADLVRSAPKRRNFDIPESVQWIVPLVCTPACEWIPSTDRKWWLFDDVPRVCTLAELMEVLSRIHTGELPSYRLPITNPPGPTQPAQSK
jgi:hypothetical protein